MLPIGKRDAKGGRERREAALEETPDSPTAPLPPTHLEASLGSSLSPPCLKATGEGGDGLGKSPPPPLAQVAFRNERKGLYYGQRPAKGGWATKS